MLTWNTYTKNQLSNSHSSVERPFSKIISIILKLAVAKPKFINSLFLVGLHRAFVIWT